MSEKRGADRRRHPRVDVPLLVQVRALDEDAPRALYTLDVSAEGVFVKTEAMLPLQTRVRILVTTRDGAHVVQGDGLVVRHGADGYAVALTGIDAAARAVLERVVRDARTPS
jgi:hypothetical protein